MSIHIGNNNTIKNSVIADKSQINQEEKNWAQRHPIISGILISVISGVILLCSFWKDAVNYIESLWR
ncbi:MAG: hypothetical protein E7050_11670 [Lentisphaerae bacterium]|nr:hypothetical protein [Lentisphaerota bacterium]